MWQTYRTAGAQCLIAVGPVENDAAAKAYAAALPRAAITLCRLHAGASELTRRIMLRGQGGGWPQPGDPLAGQPAACLLRVAASAAADAEALEHAVIGALRIDIDRLTVEEAADVIAALTGWPKRADQQAHPCLQPSGVTVTFGTVAAARPELYAVTLTLSWPVVPKTLMNARLSSQIAACQLNDRALKPMATMARMFVVNGIWSVPGNGRRMTITWPSGNPSPHDVIVTGDLPEFSAVTS